MTSMNEQGVKLQGRVARRLAEEAARREKSATRWIVSVTVLVAISILAFVFVSLTPNPDFQTGVDRDLLEATFVVIPWAISALGILIWIWRDNRKPGKRPPTRAEMAVDLCFGLILALPTVLIIIATWVFNGKIGPYVTAIGAMTIAVGIIVPMVRSRPKTATAS